MPRSFSLKSIGIAIVVLALGLGMSGKAQAQQPRGTFTMPAQDAGRQVVVPFPDAKPVAPAYPAYPVAYTLVPAIVMSDGSVYANFGYGYVAVSRACGASRPRVLDGRGMNTTQRATQQAPAQGTPSQQNLPSVQAQRRAADRAAQGACYGQDSYGRIVVVR